jgi:hypothetical protein
MSLQQCDKFFINKQLYLTVYKYHLLTQTAQRDAEHQSSLGSVLRIETKRMF